MNKAFKMSLFMPPISPVRDENGRTVKYPTLTPYQEIALKEVWKLVTSNLRLQELTDSVRAAAESGDEKAYRRLKQETLPYVTPCGIFSYRQSDRLTAPSGLTVVDIDHLDSLEEAEALRRRLFDDPFLHCALVFVSPSGRGVKAFVPYDLDRKADVKQNAAENIYWLMNYVQFTYGNPEKADTGNKGVDHSGKDLVRACFLSHDEGALLRE